MNFEYEMTKKKSQFGMGQYSMTHTILVIPYDSYGMRSKIQGLSGPRRD